MKYAVFLPADQTIVYVTKPDVEGDGPWEGTTTCYAHARLWDTEEEARVEANSWGRDAKGPCAYVEKVLDEDEVAWRAQEDTW